MDASLSLTTTEAASQLQLTKRTVAFYCRSGVLVARKHGRDWQIPAAEVSRYARDRRPPGPRPRESG